MDEWSDGTTDKEDTDDEYNVRHNDVFMMEEILATRTRNGRRQYLLKWEGFERYDELTWEYANNVPEDAITSFHVAEDRAR
jgi:hypothetical protein